MNQLVDIVIVAITLFFLIQGAELLMKGAVVIAEKLKISKLVIASTLIAFGTGLPTIAVNVALTISGPEGSAAAIGNALGTNFVNIGLALGIPAFLITIITKYEVFEKEIPIFLGMTGLYTSFILDGVISRIEGVIILISYFITLYIIYQYSLREKLNKEDREEVDLDTSTLSETKVKGITPFYAIINIILGLVCLTSFSMALAYMSPILSRDWGISEYILGLTVIGIGTSLPTIITSVRSALKGYTDIVLGNVFGGTIANIALGLGLPAIIHELHFSPEAVQDTYYFNLLNMFVLFGMLVEMKLLGGNRKLSRISGIILITFYIIYLVSKLI